MIEPSFHQHNCYLTGFAYIYNGRQGKGASFVAAGSHIKHAHR